MSEFTVDGVPVSFRPSDSVLTAMLRAGEHPTGGGALCCAGDCPHCLAAIDGVAYMRTCQVRPADGMVVQRHPADAYPPLPVSEDGGTAPARVVHCEVLVIGGGESGTAAAEEARAGGRDVVVVDAGDGEEAIGIYAGPLVVVRTPTEMRHVYPQEIVVATGAAEIQPACPGNDLAGIVTARAVKTLVSAGVDLGSVARAVGEPPPGMTAVPGELVRIEGDGAVEAVVTRTEDGVEHRHPCDTVVVGLGLHPRNALARMAGDLPVRVVGEAAMEGTIPPPPTGGTVCPCAGATVADLQTVYDRGFHELELVKRATLAGTGTCQGSACLPHIRSFLADAGGNVPDPFTARPVTRQITLGEISAGHHLHATPRTALDAEHRALGAQMDRIGGWWRPWNYGDYDVEYRAVREAVSIGDVSTLGKMLVSGPDAAAFLERLYPTYVADIAPGRSRYVLILDERGYILDDGLVCRDDDTRFTLTFTSSGATFAEMWLRDWAETWGCDVRILNQTMSLGAVNVTGPLAKELLARAGVTELPSYMSHSRAAVAGVPCRIYRLSFTGELSYELHHAVEESVELWRELLELGEDLGVAPHGLETLLDLRLEKGHIIVHQDTDFDSTPRRVGMTWAAKLDKPDFVGKPALLRTGHIPLDRKLVGLETEGEAPDEGAIVWVGADFGGYVTSSTWSPVLGKSVMLAWLHLVDGELPEVVTVADREARRVPTPFYDPEGARARA